MKRIIKLSAAFAILGLYTGYLSAWTRPDDSIIIHTGPEGYGYYKFGEPQYPIPDVKFSEKNISWQVDIQGISVYVREKPLQREIILTLNKD